MAVSKEQMQELTSLVNGTQPKATDGLEQNNEERDENLELEGDDDGEETLEGSEGAEENEENEEGEGDDDAELGDGEDEVFTPKQLADALDWEPSDVYDGIVIPMDDGQPPVKLGELKNKFQDQTRQIATLEEQVTSQGSQLAEAQTGFNQGQQLSAEMQKAQAYMQNINQMEANTNWAELEADDPTEAVLRRQKFNQAKQDVGGHIQQLQQIEHGQKQQALAAAGTKMLENIPTWSDPAVKKADQDVIRVRMKEVGYTDGQIDQISDPLAMTLLKELIDLRAEKAAATKAVKKVRKAPRRTLKGGKRVARGKGTNNTQKIVKQAKKSGNKNDALNAAKAILNSSQQ